MKLRKLMIILILIIFLFSIASVTAANTTDVMTSVDDSTQKNEIISKENEEIIKDGTTGTFTELNDKIRNGGSEITLDKNYTCEDGFSTDGITIRNSITIDGQGHTIDAQGKARIFFVNADNVVLKNIIFKNGKTTGPGGAILWERFEGSVLNCSFNNNQANGTECDGGAICWKSTGGIISNCSFTNNQVTGTLSEGGAIWMSYGTVLNCSFTNNRVIDDWGGAIYFVDEGTVSNCYFTGNIAAGEGSAIWMSYGTVLNSSFTNNHATSGQGGAVRIYTVGTVINCYFMGNTAGQGGAVSSPDTGTGSADTCIFKTSSDTTYNTCILSPTLNVDNFTSFYGSGEKITFNLTTNSGIPVTNGNISISVYFKNGVWVRNYTCLSGEGWIPDLPVGLYYAIFNTEYAEFQPINRTLKISDGTTFWDLNQTINADTQSEINLINNYTFNPDYDADFVDGIVINRSVTIKGNGFTINAKGKARIFEVLVDNVVLKNIIFKNGNITGDGGAVHFGGSGTVENCNFTNNSADYAGGAIHMYSGSVENCIFINNTARYGGAIRFYNNGTTTNCNFTNNKAIGINPWGGAICFSNIGNITNCNFAGNTAEDGGAVYFMNNGTMSNCNFTNNSAGYAGGAIAMLSGNVLNCNFIYNAANIGGAIDMGSGSVSNSTFTGNTGGNNGGAVRITREGLLTNCKFTNNKASSGSAINSEAMCSVVNCSFVNNIATGIYSGAINMYCGSVVGCIFDNNSANRGAAIRFFASSNSFVSGCIFMNHNNGNEIIYFDNTMRGNNLSVNNNIFLNNSIDAIVFNQTDSSSNCDYNWFGADASNYMIDPNLPNCNVWLFLNATANPDVLSLVDVSKITFKLNAFNSSSNKTSEYNNGLLYPVDLALTAVNGDVISTAKLNETIIFTPNTLGTGNVTASIGNVVYTIELSINKIKTELSANAITTTYNIDKDLVITLKDSNGNPVTNATITVDLNGAKTYTTDTNGQVMVSTLGLVPKIYTAKITFAGDNNYNGSSMDVGVTVNKATPILKAKKKTYKAKTKTKKFTIVLKDNTGKPIQNAKVRLIVKKITKSNKKGGSDKESKADKKKNFAVTNNKGKATFKVLRNKKGKYNAKVKFYSNEYYNKVTNTVKIVIK